MTTAKTIRHIVQSTVACALLTAASAGVLAAKKETIPYDVTKIFFELNNTDGDLGIHALVDGEPWERLKMYDSRNREMLNIRVRGRLQQQGLTELFFESAEPPFESDEPDEDALPPAEFFARFPEGTYRVEGVSTEGDRLYGESGVTHVMPAPPAPVINGMEAAEDCDAELPVVASGVPVTISWDPVTHSHPDLGASGELIDVHNYEVVVEIDETPYAAHAILPDATTQFVLPAEILSLGNLVKFEVLVREASYNQTAVESCFCVDACE